MASQLAFDLGVPRPSWPELPQPVFFCLLPTRTAAESAARIGRKLAGELGCTVKPVAGERMHISLQGLGDARRMPDRVISAARCAAGEVVAASFEVSLDNVLTLRAGARPFPSALMGFNAGVRTFNEMLCQRLIANGLQARSAVNPHMTLFYSPEPVVPRPIEPVRFMVKEFVLIRSVQGRGKHLVLGRWSLPPTDHLASGAACGLRLRGPVALTV